MTAELFDPAPYRVAPALQEVDTRTAGQKRRDRQLAELENGRHPITHRPLHPDAPPAGDLHADGPRCQTCRFRRQFGHHDRSYPKCWLGATNRDVPYASHGEATDVRAWWPACDAYEPREETSA